MDSTSSPAETVQNDEGTNANPVAPTLRKQSTRSDVWNDFNLIVKDGHRKAECKHCKQIFTARPKDGTSHLQYHRNAKHRQKKKTNIDQLLLKRGEKKSMGLEELKNFKFDQEVSRNDLARMIILHEYPFSIVDHHAFREFVGNLQPLFKLVTRNTIKKDCLKIFLQEKEKLYAILDALPSRVSLTSDMWTSTTNKGYLCLTCHYVDGDWKLQKQILSFVVLETRHTAGAISNAILEKLYEWNIDKKLFSLVLDNCSVNDGVIRDLLRKLTPKGDLLLDGQMFHVRCCAHILNLIVQDGIESIRDVTVKVRESVKYINSSTLRLQKFEEVAYQVKAPRKSLLLDVSTRWNSTYLMLARALEFKNAFERMSVVDNQYIHGPSSQEWNNVEVVCGCLKYFYEVTKIFSGTLYPTSNLYFNHVCAIHLHLKALSASHLSFVQVMAEKMRNKFLKYWNSTCKVLAIASILDPRMKMNSIEYHMIKIYEEESGARIAEIKSCLYDLYFKYKSFSEDHSVGGYTDSSSCINNNGSMGYGVGMANYSSSSMMQTNVEDILNDFDNYLQQKSASKPLRSDLEMYLDEAVHPKQKGSVDNFDILAWWRLNAAKYPILAQMACDILSIPISTVASESSFSTGGRVLGKYHCSMKTTTLESLVCAQDWIRRGLREKDIEVASLSTIFCEVDKDEEDTDAENEETLIKEI